MKYRLLSFSSILLVFSFLSVYSFTYSSYPEFYNSIINVQADKNEVFEVKNFAIEKGDAKFQMNNGYIVLGTPLEGRVRMAYFVGKGSFSFTPQIEVEKNQLRRYYEVDSINDNVTSFFFICGDSLLYTLRSKLNRTSISELSPVIEGFHNAVGVAAISHKTLIREDIENALIDNKVTPFFFGVIGFKKGNFFAYIENPNDFEDITYSEIEWKAPIGGKSKLICSYSSNERRRLIQDPCAFSDIKIKKYQITADITGSKAIICKINVQALKNSLSWYRFTLNKGITMDSVFDSKDDKVYFYKLDNSERIILKLNINYNELDTFSIILFYRLNSFYSDNGNYCKISGDWYPQQNKYEKSYFDIRVITENDVGFNSNLSKIGWERYSKKQKISRFISDKPISSPLIFIEKGFTGQTRMKFTPYAVVSNTNSILRKIMERGSNESFAFYSNLFGTLDTISGIMPSYGNSGAWKYFSNELSTQEQINLNWLTTAQNEARKWWGGAIETNSYRDEWLSDGFSTYSGLLFLQNGYGYKDFFYSILDQSRKFLSNDRKTLIGNSIEIGPLAIGDRNRAEFATDWRWVSNDKGAFILHMLRTMLIDLNTMNESKFTAMLHEYYTNNKGKTVTTNDFKNIVEKYFDADMSWFFDEWVDGYKTPKYTYGWEYEQIADDQYIVKVRIKQERVDSTFMAQVLMKLDFDDNKSYLFRAMANGPFTEYISPPLPLKPTKLEFNYLESVLCDFSDEDYDDVK